MVLGLGFRVWILGSKGSGFSVEGFMAEGLLKKQTGKRRMNWNLGSCY